MKADIYNNGDVTVRFNIMHDKLLSPDGTQQLIPCETCCRVVWVELNVVSVVCNQCVSDAIRWAETLEDVEENSIWTEDVNDEGR